MKKPTRIIYKSLIFSSICLSLTFTAAAGQVVSLIPAPSQTAATAAFDAPWVAGIFGGLFDGDLSLDRSGPPFPPEASLTDSTAPTATETAVAAPTAAPTLVPTASPTLAPTAAPTAQPTAKPTAKPTAAPTPKPTAAPTAAPTTAPTTAPTQSAATPDPNLCIINLPGVPSNPCGSSQQAKIDGFVVLVNEARATANQSPLSIGNSSMQQMAAIRAAEISVQFGHSRPTADINSQSWSDLLFGLNISFTAAGENVTGIDHESGPNTYISAMNVLMNSAGHRANILDSKFTSIAIGVYTDPAGKDWYVQEFFG